MFDCIGDVISPCSKAGNAMNAKRIRNVGIYLRVSTSDQTTRNQRRELKEVAERNGWNVIKYFEDAGISGSPA